MKKNYILLVALLISVFSFAQTAGDIIITEIMQNPDPISDTLGEYFEVYNTTDADIDMNGWVISDNGTNSHTITTSLIVSAGGYKVLGISDDTSVNGNIPVDYTYTDIALANGDDELILTTAGGVEIDRVEWDGGPVFPDPSGKSMNLDIAQYSATANDDGANWCESTTPMGSQYGTPGDTNTSCAVPCDLMLGDRNAVCDATTSGVDTYTATLEFTEGNTSTYVITASNGNVSGDSPSTIDSGIIIISAIDEGTDVTVNISNTAVGGSCDLSVVITSPVCIPAICEDEGTIIFTEIMQNPSDPIVDIQGEWFELYNTTTNPIDLVGWSIVDDSHTLYEEGFVFESSVIIPANGYVLIANNGDSSLNGGLPTPDYVYDYTATGLTLGNGADGITIQCPTGTIIDSVIWDGGPVFPDPSGASMSLDVAFLNSADNDNGANWQTATFSFGSDGQLGTPGGPNNEALSSGLDEINGFSVYPNPVINGSIMITTENTLMKEVTLYNILGKLVYSDTFTGTATLINIQNINTGIYIIKVKEGDYTSTRKLVVK